MFSVALGLVLGAEDEEAAQSGGEDPDGRSLPSWTKCHGN